MNRLTVREIKGLSPSDLLARYTEAVTDQASRKGKGIMQSSTLDMHAGRLAAEIMRRMNDERSS